MAEQSDSGARQGGVSVSTSRPLVLPVPYNGEGDLSNWTEHFESVAAVNGWKEPEKLLWLRVRLVGRAATAFNRVPNGAWESYGDCMEALKERINPSS